jgi:hypothetical protein
MMVLACKYFVERNSFNANELEKLKILVLDYRSSTLSFLNASCNHSSGRRSPVL